jgi:hypothetical protein
VVFLKTVSDQEATGEVAEIYRQQREASGYVPESTRALTTRPDVLVAYTRFPEVIRQVHAAAARLAADYPGRRQAHPLDLLLAGLRQGIAR